MEFTAQLRATYPPHPDPVTERNTPDFCAHMYQQAVTPPHYWTKFTSDKTVKDWKVSEKIDTTMELVNVDKNTFDVVDNLVQQSWVKSRIGHGHDAKGLTELNFTQLRVKSVQRIENLNLLEPYGNKRQELFHAAGKGLWIKCSQYIITMCPNCQCTDQFELFITTEMHYCFGYNTYLLQRQPLRTSVSKLNNTPLKI